MCAGWKVVGEGKPEILSIVDYPQFAKDPTNDKALVRDLSAILLGADAWLTWYGTYFDVPYLNSRLLYNHLPTLPPGFPHIDGWRTARNRLKLSRNRLVSVQEFLGLEESKTPISGPTWVKARAGHEPSIKYVERHCYQDVLVLEGAYNRLRPLIVDHPNAGLIKGGQCPICGEKHLQKRGLHVAKTRVYQRFQCQACGSWCRSVKPGTKATVTL